jgi:hypothetical protein
LTHAENGAFFADSLALQQRNCLAIGVQGFNKKSLGVQISSYLQKIVAPDMSYFGVYSADIIKLAYANMHPLTHWNRLDLDVSKVKADKKIIMSESEGPIYKPKLSKGSIHQPNLSEGPIIKPKQSEGSIINPKESEAPNIKCQSKKKN